MFGNRLAQVIVLVAWLTIVPSRTIAQGIGHHGGALPAPVNNTQTIPQDLGTTVCNDIMTACNLFHPFINFNIDPGQIVIFEGKTNITNVLARVTGGSASTIEGILRTSGMPDANFFLMNPYGVIFGPGAQLDVGGSFAVTTANEIMLAGTGKFAATPDPIDSVLTTAAPIAFGFLTDNPAPVQLTPTDTSTGITALQVGPAKTLSIVAGDVDIKDSVIIAPSGRVNIVSVGSQGTVNLDVNDLDAQVAFDQDMLRGNVSVNSSLTILHGNDGSGSSVIRANDLTLVDNSRMTVQGGQIDLDLTEHLLIKNNSNLNILGGASLTIRSSDLSIINNSQIRSLSTGVINSGKIDVNLSGDLLLSNKSRITAEHLVAGAEESFLINVEASNVSLNDSFIEMLVNSFNTRSHPGPLSITADYLSLVNGSMIRFFGFPGSVSVGEIHIHTNFLYMNGLDNPSPTAILNLLLPLPIPDATFSPIGNIVIGPRHLEDTNRIEVVNGAQIATTQAGLNTDAGNIKINANDILLDGQNNPFFSTGIVASSQPFNPRIGGGNVTIYGDKLQVIHGATISTTTKNIGQGGNIIVDLGHLEMERGTIESNSDSPGTAAGGGGTISVTSDGQILLRRESRITATAVQSDGGDIAIHAGTTIDLFDDSEITTAAGVDGGNVTLTAPQRVLVQDSTITANAEGDGGNIIVDVGHLEMERGTIESDSDSPGTAAGGGGTISVTSDGQILLRRESRITATAVQSDGGDIAIHAGTTIDLFDDSEITTAAGVDGGNVTLTAPQRVLVQDSTITANAEGDGGNIIVDVGHLEMERGTIESDSDSPGTAAGGGGTISVTSDGQILLREQSIITANAFQSNGGDIAIDAGTTIDLFDDSQITANAGIDGGNITLTAPQRVLMRDSKITTEAEGNGGNITIDPVLVNLQGRSVISANAVNGAGGNIAIFTNILGVSPQSRITASSQRGVSGVVNITGILDLAGNLVTLPTSLLTSTELTLQPRCAVQFSEDASSFTIRSTTGLPIQPDGWWPSFQQSTPHVNQD